MRPLNKFAQKAGIRFLIGLLVVFLCGCSMARLGYNNGETVSYFWLNGYIGFDADQKPWVKKELASLFAWHRRTQLPEYLPLLAQAKKRVQKPVTEAELARDYEEIRRRILVITDRAAPAAADLAQRQRDRFKRTMKQAEIWFGNFSGEQERQIRQLSDARPLDDEMVLADRMQRQAEMIRMLQRIEAEKPTREAAVGMLRQYVSGTMDHFNHPEYQSYFEKYRAAQMRLVAGIINLGTPAQKQHFEQAVQGWMDDFDTLSRLDPPPAAQRISVN
jgi:hypothetical protein